MVEVDDAIARFLFWHIGSSDLARELAILF